MATLSLGLISQLNASTRVHDGRLLDDKTITVQTVDVAARVGQGNLVDFIGIQPNLALSAFQYGSGEALLKFERDYK